jgi:hypothetical protein
MAPDAHTQHTITAFVCIQLRVKDQLSAQIWRPHTAAEPRFRVPSILDVRGQGREGFTSAARRSSPHHDVSPFVNRKPMQDWLMKNPGMTRGLPENAGD